MRDTHASSLAQDEVHLWSASAPNFSNTEQFDYWMGLLSEDELQRYQRLNFEYLKNEYVLARAMCRIILSRYEPSTAPRMWRFECNPWGRPKAVLPSNARALDFNLAHSHGMVVMAVADLRREVGVDVEAVNPAHAGLDIAKRYFSPTEQAGLEQLPPDHQVEHFFELWAAKEAYIKARGYGLSLALDAFAVDIQHGQGEDSIAVRLVFAPQDDDINLRQFLLCNIAPRYKLALCVRRTDRDESVKVRKFTFALSR